jgi:hypothetical protein
LVSVSERASSEARTGINKRETGGRVLKEGSADNRPDPIDTGDKGDEPKKPYGLTRPVNETETKTRTSEGVRPSKRA